MKSGMVNYEEGREVLLFAGALSFTWWGNGGSLIGNDMKQNKFSRVRFCHLGRVVLPVCGAVLMGGLPLVSVSAQEEPVEVVAGDETAAENVQTRTVVEPAVVMEPEKLRKFLSLPGIDVRECYVRDSSMYGDYVCSLLDYAVMQSCEESVRLLLDTPGIDTSAYHPVALAVAANDPARLKALFALGYTVPRRETGSLLHDAVESNMLECVELLLSRPEVDVNALAHDETPLYVAVRYGFIDCVRLLLKSPRVFKKPHGAYRRWFNEEEIMESVLASKRVDILKLLLENHYLRSFYLRGMVLYAAEHSSAECMALLLKMEYTLPNEAGEDGDTALHIAARRNDADMVRTLLADGRCRASKRNGKRQTALQLAVESGNAEAAAVLRTMGNRIEQRIECPSIFAVPQDIAAAVENESSNPFYEMYQPDADGYTLLHRAVLQQDEKALALMLKQPWVPVNVVDNEGNTPLHLAMQTGNPRLVQMLVETPGIDVTRLNDQGNAPHEMYPDENRNECLAVLLKHPTVRDWYVPTDPRPLICNLTDSEACIYAEGGADANKCTARGTRPLHLAAWSEHIPMLEALINVPGIDVNMADPDGRTPLHYATTMNQHESIITLLGKGGADSRVRDHLGHAPLHALAYSYCIMKAPGEYSADTEYVTDMYRTTLEIYKSFGVDLNMRNAQGQTLLLMALFEQNPVLLSVLLADESVDVNAVDENGYTALHWAVLLDDRNAAELLAWHTGVDLHKKDNKGRTPQDLLKELSSVEMKCRKYVEAAYAAESAARAAAQEAARTRRVAAAKKRAATEAAAKARSAAEAETKARVRVNQFARRRAMAQEQVRIMAESQSRAESEAAARGRASEEAAAAVVALEQARTAAELEIEAATRNRAAAETEAATRTQVWSETVALAKSAAAAESQARAAAEALASSRMEGQPMTAAEAEARAAAEAEAAVRARAEASLESLARAAMEARVRLQAAVDAETAARAKRQAVAQAEPQTRARAEIAARAWNAAKAKARTWDKPKAEAELKAQVAAQALAAAEVELRVAVENRAVADAEAAAASKAWAEAQAEAKAAARAKAKAEAAFGR